ncbi:MAG: acyl--CoA ligase [Syntrophomonadaceae bacterium]|nr:acyl--CoA ligase [Syntrophomonadaceae bacterium]
MTVTKKNRLEGALPLLSDYMRKWAREMPDHAALIYQDQPMSYRELEHNAEQLAKYMLSIGVKKGDRIAYVMVCRPEFFVLYMAASMIGAIIVGMNVRHTPPEMEYVLNNSLSSHVMAQYSLAEINYQERLAKALKNIPAFGQVWIYGGPVEMPNAISVEEILAGDYSQYDQELKEREAQVGPDDGLIIVYTSGTTGHPKGAVLTHHNVVSMSLVLIDEFHLPTGMKPEHHVLHMVPTNHVSGATEWGAAPLVAGATQVLLGSFDPTLALQMAEKYKVEMLEGVPTMWALMFAHPNFKDFDLSSVQFCMIGGAPAPKDILSKMLELAPYCCNPMGMTETAGLSTYSDRGSSLESLNLSVGKCAPEWELKLVDADRKEVPQGTVGEISYRGAIVFKEYFNMPEATAAAKDSEGWFYSKDMGMIDENGDLRLVGRLQEMYITGGYNVYPAEIEEQISRYPGVLMNAVIPVPHPIMGEVGRGFIVPKPGEIVDPAALQEYLKDYLADYKIPRQWEIRDSFPLTTLGKIEKKILKKELEERLA